MLFFQLYRAKHGVVDDIHVVGVDAFADQRLAAEVLNLLDALNLRQDEVRIAAYPHASPRLVVVVVLALHQFQRLVGILVVQLHGLFDADVHRVAESVVYLDESYDTVVDECNELRSDTFSHQ